MLNSIRRAFCFGNHINEWSIQRGLARLGVSLECIGDDPGLVPRSSGQPVPDDALFFTEERSIKKYLKDDEFRFYPQIGDTRIVVDDKLAFAEWLEEVGESPVPYTPELDRPFAWPMVVKAKHSWLGDDKLIRGFVCRDCADLERSLAQIEKLSLPLDCFFLQQYIVGTNNVYSTCGFFDYQDKDRQVMIATRKLLATGAEIGTGAIVSTVRDPAHLIARTKHVLSQARYVGPFELEFLVDAEGGFFVLELNPRFWMQHGIFVEAFDNLLLKLCLDYPDYRTDVERERLLNQSVVWLNRCYFVRTLMSGRLNSAARFLGVVRVVQAQDAQVYWFPSWQATVRYLVLWPYVRISRMLRRYKTEIDSLQKISPEDDTLGKLFEPDPQSDAVAEPHPSCKEAEFLDHYALDSYHATSSRLMGRWREGSAYRAGFDAASQARGQPRPTWPGGASFAVCLTHDVDNVALGNPRMILRRAVSQLRCFLVDRDPMAARAIIGSIAAHRRCFQPWKQDPLHCYEQWLEIEQEVGAKSTFFFLPDAYGLKHCTDGGYRHRDRVIFDGDRCTVAEMMRAIHQRGWEVGLHASWKSHDSLEELTRQKNSIEAAIGESVQSVRHHFLKYDIRVTPRIHAAAGLHYDSSIGFNDDLGFRYGTCIPWQLTDVATREPLGVFEVPLIVQDIGLFESLAHGHPDLAFEWFLSLLSAVKDVGGVLTLLWHPGTIRKPAYIEVYQRALAHLAGENAWFGTVAEIGQWWQAQQTTQRIEAA